MKYQWAIAIAMHQLGTIVWVGGMFFAHMVLRPAVNALLEPQQRVPLMAQVLGRFFRWVWVALALLWGSGLWILLAIYGGNAAAFVHAMMGIASVMTALFVYIWFVPFQRLKAEVLAADWNAAAVKLGSIRTIILVNLVLGLIAALLGAAGQRV
jgi:uncharacterized membrane protein